jgi:hypothetical protein
VFLLNVPVATVALVAGFFLVPNGKDPQPGAFDLIGAGLSAAALGSLVYGLIKAPSGPTRSSSPRSALLPCSPRPSSGGSSTRPRRC